MIVKAIRFSRELNKKIEKEAKRNKVSFSKFVVEACKYALDHMEKE